MLGIPRKVMYTETNFSNEDKNESFISFGNDVQFN